MNKSFPCNNFQAQIWRAHVCMNCFQIESQHDSNAKQTTTKTTEANKEQKRPNGILKRTNFKALTPEFPPRHFRTNTLRLDWLTPPPQTKINKFEYTQTEATKSLNRKEKDLIPPLIMNIPLSSRTEPDGQLDEPITSSPPSVTSGIQKKQLVTSPPIQIQPQTTNKLSLGSIKIPNSPNTPQVLPYAVSIVNDQEVQDCYNFNQLEQVYNEIQHTPKSKSSQQPSADKPNRNQTQFHLFQVSPNHGIPEKITSKPNDSKPLSISTDSGTEMDAITPIIPINDKMSLRVSPSKESRSFRNLLSPRVRRRHRSDGPKSSFDCPDSPTSTRSLTGAMTACIPIRLPKWSQRKRSKSKEQKSPRKRELCKEDIHVLPPNSFLPQMHQKSKIQSDSVLLTETSPTYCGIASLSLDQFSSQMSPPKNFMHTNGPLSPIKPDPFSPTASQPSHQYLPLNLVPMSAVNHREELHSRFPAFSIESPFDMNIVKRKKPFPLTPNASQEREERILNYERPILKEFPSPVSKRNKQPSKPVRTFRTDNTHLLKYKSKSEMNLGVVGIPAPFFEGYRMQFRSQMNGSVTPHGIKPEIPAFPPNASQDEVKRSLVNVSNVGYMQPTHPYVATRQPSNRYNRHVRTGSLYENVDICTPQVPNVIEESQATLDSSSTGDLLDSQTKSIQSQRPSSINTSDSGSYVQMRIDQSISEEIGQAVTLYKKIVNENAKLIRLFADQLYKQLMQGVDWETMEWDKVEIVDNQRQPLNIAILIQQNEIQKEFSLLPKDLNPDDIISRAFQSIQAISSSIPRSPYVLYAHTLIDIPIELKEKCPSLQHNEIACVLDQTRAGTLEQHLTEHKPLLDLDPERYERNIVIYLIQILTGVAHMHRHKVVHRDLNMSDILLSRETEADEILQVKISGFTYALHRPGPPRSQPFLYSFEELQWLGGDETKLPPEITNAQNNVPELNYSGTDCFAIGCLIYEMMHEGNPFDDQNLITKSYATEELPNFVQRSKYTVWIQKIAKGLLEMNIQRRLDANYALAILQLIVFDGERLLTDQEINEKKIKTFISDLQGKYLNRIIEKSSLTLLTGRAFEMNVFEKIELNFLANSQPYTIVRAIKHFQNIS